MKKINTLSPREKEIAELLAWGASQKEVADHLYISESTVANHKQSIFSKTGCKKVNELSAWWFCNRFRIPMSLSPLARNIVATVLLTFYLFGAINNVSDHQRVRIRPRINNTTRARRNENRNEKQLNIYAA